MVVGVEDPHDEPVEAEQDDDREHHAAQADRELVELLAELVAGDRRDHDRRDRDEDQRDRAQDDQDQAEQRPGELERLLALALLEQLGEDGDEGGAQRGVGDQRAEQVRDLERDRERGERAGGAEVARRDHFPDETGDPGEPRRDREDDRVERNPAPRLGGRNGRRGQWDRQEAPL